MSWKKLAAYPPGHPLRAGAVAAAHGELRALLDLGKPVDLGVSRDGLSWGEQRLQSVGSRQIAEALYQSNIAVLRFSSEILETELEAFLLGLKSRPAETGGEPLATRLAAAGVIHIELRRADFSSLRATDDLEGAPRPRLDLWDRILRWHLEGKPEVAGGGAGGGLATVLAWVHATLSGTTDLSSPEAQKVLEVLLGAVEADLREPAPGLSPGLRVRQISELLQALPAALRGPILDAALVHLMGAEGDPVSFAMLAAAVSPTATVASLGRLRAQGLRFPPAAARLIEELARALDSVAEKQAGDDTSAPAERPPGELDLGTFSRREDPFLELPPSGLGAAHGGFDDELQSFSARATLQRLVRTMLAMLASPRLEARLDGVVARLEAVFANLLVGGHTSAAYALVLELGDLAQAPASAAGARRALAGLASERSVAVLVGTVRRASPGELEHLHRLVERLGPEPIRRLLVALGEAEDRTVRRALFNFLQAHASAVVEVAPAVLADRRWFVVRNVLSLLHAVGDRRALAGARACLEHPDARVRVEALKVVGRLGREDVGDAVLAMFADPEERIVRYAMQLAGELRLRSAVAPLLELLKPLDLNGQRREQRLRALRSLGEIGDPAALAELKRFFVGVPPFVSLEERRAAYQSLAGYPEEDRRPWVIRGLRSRDPETLEACRALVESEGGSGA